MELSKLSKEELETLGYDDIAYLLLKEKNKKMKIIDLFNGVCEILGLPSSEYEDKIADFFEILTTNKKFIMLDKGFWDLKENHSPKIIIDEEEDEEEVITEVVEETDEEDSDDIYYEDGDNDDNIENELEDLVVIDSDDDETNTL